MVDSGDEPHRGDEGLPGSALAGEHPPALGGEPVETPAPLPRFLHPSALQPAALLEAIEEGVERGDVEFQLTGRSRLDQAADLVAVPGAALDDGEDDQLGRALLQLAVEHAAVNRCHRQIWYSRGLGRVTCHVLGCYVLRARATCDAPRTAGLPDRRTAGLPDCRTSGLVSLWE